MFLEVLKKRNIELIDYTMHLHHQGLLLPDTYVIDLDSLLENARMMKQRADQLGIDLLFMLKQVGRNPYIAQKLMEIGYAGAVAVDFKEVQTLMDHGIPLGNVGHLVQIPDAMLSRVLRYGVEEITIYSLEKLQRIQQIAKELSIKQKVLLRVYEEGDILYESQKAGFSLHELSLILDDVSNMENVEICGVTTFPCFLFDEAAQELKPTHNAQTLLKAKDILERYGIKQVVVNMPSASCIHTLPYIQELGGTQAEPGHALTGTTPYHQISREPERPALLYLSEISHTFQGKSYAYGGGYYRRGHLQYALLGKQIVSVNEADPSAIDYHIELNTEECNVGNPVIMCFRTQIFVTRSDVAIVEGLHSSQPHIQGIYDSQGRKKG